MDINRQTSHGNNSPNINVDGDFLVSLAKNRPSGKEVGSILEIIVELTNQAIEEDTSIDDASYKKLLKQKLIKYPEYAARLNHDYALLAGVYARPYDTAWQNSGVDELTRKKIAMYLSGRSIALLETHDGNAIMAIDQLCTEIQECVTEGTDFDSNAIRFFIYRQFIECNVFPLIEDEV